MTEIKTEKEGRKSTARLVCEQAFGGVEKAEAVLADLKDTAKRYTKWLESAANLARVSGLGRKGMKQSINDIGAAIPSPAYPRVRAVWDGGSFIYMDGYPHASFAEVRDNMVHWDTDSALWEILAFLCCHDNGHILANAGCISLFITPNVDVELLSKQGRDTYITSIKDYWERRYGDEASPFQDSKIKD